eukprot:scaffold6800_cov89-Skeletonema_dohrnii-CCMP3373.AAC.2
MDDATFTSDAVSTTRQLMAIRSSMSKENEDEDSRDLDVVIKDLAKKGVTLNKEQLTALSTEFLLTVLLDAMLLHLLDKGATVSSDRQQLMDVAAAAKKKKKAAAKKKRYKRNKAAAKQQQKETRLMPWLSGGIISVIIMVAFSFITTPIVTLSLIQPSDGLGEGKAPPALPPSASKSLRQEDMKSNDEASTSPDIISPLAAVVPTPVFAPTALTIRRMKFDKMRASTCLDTPNWKDKNGNGCDWYEEYGRCAYADNYAGDMGLASNHCCVCEGGSTTSLFAVEAADHYVEVVTVTQWGDQETFGLYNECKCDFWSRLCEDSGVGEACDYAAEYCCADYSYGEVGFRYKKSPSCYCDFFNYARNEFGHKLKSKALNTSDEFKNPCSQTQDSAAILMLDQALDYRLQYERPSLEAIYNETVGQNWTNNAGWMNETEDYCEWHGISCDGDGYVTSIDLRDNNLTGQFPVYTRNEFSSFHEVESNWIYSKYGLANLYNLRRLDLANNKLTGTIEYRPLYNLHSLTHFDVSGNQLSGEIDALVTPSLTYADFSRNRFTSMRQVGKLKQSFQTLRFCDVSNNAIEKEATGLLENIPPNIEQFFASNNRMHGNLPASLNSLSKLSQFDMSSNALSGSLPGFADSILSLQELDLSNQNQKNGFTGSIPKDLWRFQSLKVLNLASNKIEGPIPPDIGKMTALEEFNLSNNRLVNAIPSELGQLAGALKRIDLANNDLSETIPSQLGQLQGASVLLRGNRFEDSSTAPLSLCTLRSVKEFDLANDTELCPVERNTLSDFYDSTKGAEWTDSTDWLDECKSYCDWNGVTCDDSNRVIKLELRNNGLSGRLRESIGDLTFIDVLDLSDNDIKVISTAAQCTGTGSIPAAIGLLSELTYLRLSYNAFTGTAPRVLGKLTKLQLLQLQSNRITKIPDNIRLDDAAYGNSTFVTYCGVPSAFDETPDCKDCTMCSSSAPIPLTNFHDATRRKRKNRGNSSVSTLTRSVAMIRRIGEEEDDAYALSRIGKESVYSYFVTDKVCGWMAAFLTLGIQVAILAFFVVASEVNLQKDTIDIVFTWKCPRDSDGCDNKADLDVYGWVIFSMSMLMIAFLAKDIINGCKLIYFSSKAWHTLGARIRYFIGGMGLFSITVFALYVSTVYNKAIATSNTEIIVNSVIVLFIMEIDEYIFSALDAINEKWTEHAADKEASEMKAQIESQQEEIDNQRNDIRMLREAVEKLQQSQAVEASDSDSQSAEFEGNTGAQQMEQVDQSTMPSEAEQKIQELNAAAATASNTTSKCTAHESITTHAAESDNTGSGTDAGKGGKTNEVKDENALLKDENVLEKGRPAQ